MNYGYELQIMIMLNMSGYVLEWGVGRGSICVVSISLMICIATELLLILLLVFLH